MMIYQDENGFYVVKIGKRTSGGHATPQAAWTAILSTEIDSLSTVNPETGIKTPPTLSQAQDKALTFLDIWRGRERIERAGFEPADWQELVYTLKIVETQRWIGNQSSAYGLALEAHARGLTNLQMAQLVINRYNAWLSASDQIESEFLQTKTAIEAALSIEDIVTALVNLVV